VIDRKLLEASKKPSGEGWAFLLLDIWLIPDR
jgi:hypothetical protein